MKVVVIGAGISGLALGYYLKKKYGDTIDLKIIEKNAIVGGYIKTIEKEGFLFELGPRSCRTKGAGIYTLQLIEDLKLESEVINEDPIASNRYVHMNKKLVKLPNGFFSLFKSPLTKGIFTAFFTDFFKFSKRRQEDESIHEFSMRKFGVTIADFMFDPLTSGVYAGNTQKLSLKSCFPILYEWEVKYGSLLRGMIFSSKKKEILSPFVCKMMKKSLISFKGGMQTLTSALGVSLEKHILCSTKIQKIECFENVGKVYLEDGSIMQADYIFSTVCHKALSGMLEDCELKKILNQFHSTTVAVVSFGFKKKILEIQGFGYLIPSKEKEDILGVVFDSLVFKEQNRFADETRLTVMIGGDHMKNFDSHSDSDFLEMAKRAIHKHLKFNDEPFVSHVEIIKNCIPQYLVGHSEKLSGIQGVTPSCLKLLGSSFYGVSVNDCIHQASTACHLI